MINQDLTAFGINNNHLVTVQDGFLMHQDSVSDFKAMAKAALNDGITITIASSFRDFERQLLIWNNKFQGIRPVLDKHGNKVDMSVLDEWQKVQAILLYSAMPGTSRHHWGCDIDVYDQKALPNEHKLQLEPHEYQDGGPFAILSNWLTMQAEKFNFYRPYMQDNGGVAPELWHLSHVPVAKHYFDNFATNADKLLNLLEQSGISGVNAIAQHFDAILEQYVYNVERPTLWTNKASK